MDTSQDKSEIEPLSFEQALERLEIIVRELEDGQTGLNDSLARYEEGVRLLKHCHAALGQAERKISLLTGIAPDGSEMSESFDELSMTMEEKQQLRSRRRSQPAQPTGLPQRTDDLTESEDPESNMDRQRGLF
jgi:exodeoxyribonuclease VII small subunit